MRWLLPPVLVVALLIPLVALWQWHPDLGQIRTDREMPWDVVLPVALLFLIGARMQFEKSRSEIVAFDDPRNLVTHGLFRWSRNPMYLGFTLLLVAAAFFVNHWCAMLAPLTFFIIANWWYIPFEEARAEAVFGDDYLAYKRRVRRWI